MLHVIPSNEISMYLTSIPMGACVQNMTFCLDLVVSFIS